MGSVMRNLLMRSLVLSAVLMLAALGGVSPGYAQAPPAAGPVRSQPLAAPGGSDVQPGDPTFVDDACVHGKLTGAMFSVPSVKGVQYTVNGSTMATGSYPAKDGSTVTITARALPGYTLHGRSSWEHTFPKAPACSAASSAKPTTSSPSPKPTTAPPSPTLPGPPPQTGPPPASTGPHVGGQVLVALALTGLGLAFLRAGRQRSASS